MDYHVIVSFNKDKQYEYKFGTSTIGATQEGARQWFNQQFETLGCDVVTPTGKVLIVDRILSVAKYAGEERFKTDPAWSETFAKNAAMILGRDVIRVDVAAYAIGY
ncbi:MAG: hypothetical protein ACM3SV_11120 [Betaproteobacteria bacterium]